MSQDIPENASAGAEEQDLPAVRERMAVIKEEVAAEVEEKWATPYRTAEVFDLKVQARLAAHQEYRELQDRVRNAETAQRTQSDTGSGD